MSSAFNHKSRSRKTYRGRMAAARYNCNYSLTRAERLMMMARLNAALQPVPAETTEEKKEVED